MGLRGLSLEMFYQLNSHDALKKRWWLIRSDSQKDKDTQVTDTDKDKVVPKPNVFYIFEKQGVLGYQIWHFLQKFPQHFSTKLSTEHFPPKPIFHLSILCLDSHGPPPGSGGNKTFYHWYFHVLLLFAKYLPILMVWSPWPSSGWSRQSPGASPPSLGSQSGRPPGVSVSSASVILVLKLW